MIFNINSTRGHTGSLLVLSPPAIFLMNSRTVIIMYAIVSKPKINAT